MRPPLSSQKTIDFQLIGPVSGPYPHGSPVAYDLPSALLKVPRRLRIVVRVGRPGRKIHIFEEVDIVFQANRYKHYVLLFLAALIGTALLAPAGAFSQVACPYRQVQVLLPGESAAPGTDSGKTGTPLTQVAGIPFEIKVRVCDGSWNTVTSVDHAFRITSTDETASLPPASPLIFGELTLDVTLNAAGLFTFTATDLSDHEHISGTSSQVTVVYGVGELDRFEFSYIDADQRAGQPVQVTIEAVDGNGSLVGTFSGTAGLTQSTSFGAGRILPQEIGFEGGSWTGYVTLYRADETEGECYGGNVTISAALEGGGPAGESNCFTVHPGDFARLQVIVPGQEPAPGTIAGITGSPAVQSTGMSFAAQVYGTDEFWNRVDGADEISLTSNDQAAAISGPAAMTDGQASFDIAFATAGIKTLTALDVTDGGIEGMTSEPIQVISSEPVFVIEPLPSPLTAGEPVTVTIRVTDSRGNPIENYNGHALLVAETGPATITPESIRFDGGSWSGDMTFFCAGGEISFSCVDFAAPPNYGTSIPVTVLPGDYAGLQVLLPGEIPLGGTVSGKEGSPADQEAGRPFQVTVRAVDSWWNMVPEADTGISLVSTDAYALIPAGTVLGGGQLTVPVTLFRAGRHSFEAKEEGSEDGEGSVSGLLDVVPGPYARVIMLAPGEELIPGSEEGKVGTPLDQTVGYSFRLIVQATDWWWNPVTGVSDGIRLTSTDPLAEIPEIAFLADGRAEFDVRLSTGGYQLLTAENTDNTSIGNTVSQVRAINSGFHIEAAVHPEKVIAGETFYVTVKVTNNAGAVMQEVNSFANIEVRNAVKGEAGEGTLLNTRFQFLQGERTLSQTYTKAESIVLLISDEGGNDPGLTNAITIEPGPPSAIEAVSDPPWVGGRKTATISASVIDGFGNGVPGQPVVFELESGLGTITPIEEVTDRLGVARALFRAAYDPETGTVRVYSNSFTTILEIETALVDPSLPGGTVTNYPNPFHPNENATTIAYKLSDDAIVSMRIFTLDGRLVLRKKYGAGSDGGSAGLNEILWDGRNGNGEVVASGGYIVLIEAERSGETIHSMRRRIGVVR